MYCIQICKTKRLKMIISLKIGPKHKRERSAKIKINQVIKKILKDIITGILSNYKNHTRAKY